MKNCGGKFRVELVNLSIFVETIFIPLMYHILKSKTSLVRIIKYDIGLKHSVAIKFKDFSQKKISRRNLLKAGIFNLFSETQTVYQNSMISCILS